MKVEAGKYYLIVFRDPDYPCHCACHTHQSVIHCMPCCYDRSYRGVVQATGKSLIRHPVFPGEQPERSHEFRRKDERLVWFGESSVVRESDEQEFSRAGQEAKP